MRSMLLPGFGRPMIVSETSRSVRSLATASMRYPSPFRATSADAVVISRPGTRATSGSGRNNSASTPTGTRRMRSRLTPMSLWMSLIEFSLTTTILGIREATRPCILTKEYQRPTDHRLRRLGRLVHLQHAIAGDRVVQGDDGRDLLLEEQDPVAEALVVVDQIEVTEPWGERTQRPETEGQRLGERAGRELQHLEEVLA